MGAAGACTAGWGGEGGRDDRASAQGRIGRLGGREGAVVVGERDEVVEPVARTGHGDVRLCVVLIAAPTSPTPTSTESIPLTSIENAISRRHRMCHRIGLLDVISD
jgi:hypothetical protein